MEEISTFLLRTKRQFSHERKIHERCSDSHELSQILAVMSSPCAFDVSESGDVWRVRCARRVKRYKQHHEGSTRFVLNFSLRPIKTFFSVRKRGMPHRGCRGGPRSCRAGPAPSFPAPPHIPEYEGNPQKRIAAAILEHELDSRNVKKRKRTRIPTPYGNSRFLNKTNPHSTGSSSTGTTCAE